MKQAYCAWQYGWFSKIQLQLIILHTYMTPFNHEIRNKHIDKLVFNDQLEFTISFSIIKFF